ncbi:hypothetical protein PVK06_011754 [Gossypium arboreum]|uniref:Uncharacterized protein n=1 Tax=Gossypium arboreum TaxID=29729 RepID=A0ABR0QAL8_GOSAR|nr:hypothetical protein PVK06_011754 [Gossypium arboreum]
MPSTHNTTVSNERMQWCAEKNAGNLNFPSPITALFCIVTAPLNADEDVKPNKGGLGTVAEELEKMTSLNLENEKEKEKDETATDIIATTKGKDPIPPTPPASMIVQDRDIDHLIDELTKTD